MQWKAARAAKDYAAADGIRSELRAVGIEAEDLAQEIEVYGLRVPVANTRVGRREGMPTHEAEALAMQWKAARAAKDYAAADGIRSELRAVGIEAEDLAQEIEIYGLSDRPHGDKEAHGASGAAVETYEPDPKDPLAYREHMSKEAKALFQPTEAATLHKDGGTGGLLTLNYALIPELPKDIGFTVTGGKAQASADALTMYKEMKRQEEEAKRRETAERNAGVRRLKQDNM